MNQTEIEKINLELKDKLTFGLKESVSRRFERIHSILHSRRIDYERLRHELDKYNRGKKRFYEFAGVQDNSFLAYDQFIECNRGRKLK